MFLGVYKHIHIHIKPLSHEFCFHFNWCFFSTEDWVTARVFKSFRIFLVFAVTLELDWITYILPLITSYSILFSRPLGIIPRNYHSLQVFFFFFFYTSVKLVEFHWSMSDSSFLQVYRNLISVLLISPMLHSAWFLFSQWFLIPSVPPSGPWGSFKPISPALVEQDYQID